MKIPEFWDNFTVLINRLKGDNVTASLVAEIHRLLQEVDKRLSIELSEPQQTGIYELIITANGYQELFPVVEDIVGSAPVLSNWNIIALKQPRGFDFIFRQQDKELSPSSWSFLPLRDQSSRLGICVFIPGNLIRLDDAVLQTIIETGIGEKAFSYLSHLEYSQSSDRRIRDSWLEMNMLPNYLQWQSRL